MIVVVGVVKLLLVVISTSVAVVISSYLRYAVAAITSSSATLRLDSGAFAVATWE
jgi:hypothetical protein